jgi:hypothetical protein
MGCTESAEGSQSHSEQSSYCQAPVAVVPKVSEATVPKIDCKLLRTRSIQRVRLEP